MITRNISKSNRIIVNKYAQSHGTFHAYQKKHGSKFTLTILAAALLVTFHTTTIASTTLASSTTPPCLVNLR